VLLTISRQWNTSFGTPQAHSNPSPQSQASAALSVSSSGPEVQQALDELSVDPLTTAAPPLQTQQYATSIPFITPAMWQESVASVYESGGGSLKRTWDFDGGSVRR
jgi:hypothetical protein